MDKTPPPRLQPGDVITALPIPREVTAVRGVHLGGSHSRYVWDRRHDGWRARIEGGARVSADAMLTEYPGGLLVVEVTPEAAPEPTPGVEPEPPVRAKRADREGYVWTRFPEGWWLIKRGADAAGLALTWEQVQAQGPLREPRPGDRDANPESTPEPLPTVTVNGRVWVEVAPDRWRMAHIGRHRLDSIRDAWGGETALDERTHTDNNGGVWVLLPDGWAITEPGTERPLADIPGWAPARTEAPELARMTLADMATAARSIPAAHRAVLDVEAQHFTVHVSTHAAFARYVGPEPQMTPDGALVVTDQWDTEHVTTASIVWRPEHTTGGVL